MIESLAWVLPRPSKNKYPGGFPLHFEKKLLAELGLTEGDRILQPFGGGALYGVRVDLKTSITTSTGKTYSFYPDVVADAHCLPFRDDWFDLVLLDPPYNDEQSERLYGTGHVKLSFKQYTAEAVRVARPGGYVVIYHWIAPPSLPGTKLVKRIFLETMVWHRLRCIHIYQKDGGEMVSITAKA